MTRPARIPRVRPRERTRPHRTRMSGRPGALGARGAVGVLATATLTRAVRRRGGRDTCGAGIRTRGGAGRCNRGWMLARPREATLAPADADLKTDGSVR